MREPIAGGARLDFVECIRGFFYNLPLPYYCEEYFKYFQPGPATEDEEDLVRPPDKTPPEETEEYKRLLRVYEDTLRRTYESATYTDSLFWLRKMDSVLDFCGAWGDWLKGKLINLSTELVACLMAGSVFLLMWSLILKHCGPLKIKTVGYTLLIFVFGTTFLKGTIEVAASCFIGFVILSFFFLTQLCTGYDIEYHRDVDDLVTDPGAGGDADGDYAVVYRMWYWYVGERSIWIDISKGLIGLD